MHTTHMALAFVVAAGLAACQQHGGGGLATCQQDSDCASPTICQTCNGLCVFRPQTACNLTAPCPCGWSCRGSVCQSNIGVAQPSCIYDRDCPVDMFCNRAKYACQLPMILVQGTGTSCTANAQCTAAGEICSTGEGSVCAHNETVQCFSDSECPTGYQCDPQGQCQHHTC